MPKNNYIVKEPNNDNYIEYNNNESCISKKYHL